MHVFQTAGVPPRNGRTIFASIGCTQKSRKALRKMVIANRAANGSELPEQISKEEAAPLQADPAAVPYS
jgi:hypothetical protein